MYVKGLFYAVLSFHLTFVHTTFFCTQRHSSAGVDKKRPSALPCRQRPKSGVGGFSWCLIPAVCKTEPLVKWWFHPGVLYLPLLSIYEYIWTHIYIHMISTYVQLCLSLLIFSKVQNNIFQINALVYKSMCHICFNFINWLIHRALGMAWNHLLWFGHATR